ncbi:MAG: NADPH-dependent glutamate synthase [Oscillospiraceae bacterium]|jgi:glutamate synthase (NADPH/NADH) small chain|nr:NADPH-dependent glutamate synthase [Oscillospiraceae bacterium]
MFNKSLVKTPMPEQNPAARARNFSEVALGYTEADAQSEAARCLRCKHKPCVAGCPVEVDIPGFVGKLAEGDPAEAYEIIRRTNALPAVCGRVCPQETQCEQKCVRGKNGVSVGIGRLERYAADWAMKNGEGASVQAAAPNGVKVAVVGSGPAGLTCAGELAGLGYEVTVFEAFHRPGGVLVYGIPEFRLPKAIVAREIEGLLARGVTLTTNCVVGRSLTLDELFAEGFRAVFIGSGAGLPTFMNIPGESLNGVYSANEFLTRVNLMRAFDETWDTPVQNAKRVAVVGGGNVAMDAARCALRLPGVETVTVVYRRGEAEMPARAEEIHHAREEGIDFKLLTNPTEVLGDDKGWVTGLACVEMELSEPDESGRRRPKPKPDSRFELPVDSVIMAIGSSPNPLIRQTTPDLPVNKWGCVVADEADGRTGKKGVYAGGDTVTGAATVILAMGAGRAAARSIHEDVLAGAI